MSQTIKKDMVVGLLYTLKDGDGHVLEERTPEEPLYYLHGHQQILPALEASVENQTVGFCRNLELAPEQAFGERRPDLVVAVPRDSFPEGVELEAGMKFDTLGPNEEELTIELVEVREDSVVVDGNHPLAGVSLAFDLRVVEVRPASEEELANLDEPPQRSPKGQLH